MDLFHFDTTNLEPAEVDFVIATLQKRDRKQFVKLPWDSKAKTAVSRQQPTLLPTQRLGILPSGNRQPLAGPRHGGGRRSAMHIPARDKPPRLQRGPQQQQYSGHADGVGRLPPPAAVSAAGNSEMLLPSSAAQLLGPAAYSAAAAGHLPFVKELHLQHQQHHLHQESAMGRYYMLPGSDEMAGVAPPPMELLVNYMHGGGSMVAGMPPMRHHSGEVPSPPPGMCHHSHPIMMPPGSISMTAHGGSYTIQHMAPAVRPGLFQMQQPYISASDLSQLPPGYYPHMPTAGPPMAGGPSMDVIFAQQTMYHHHQLPMPSYPSAAQYSMAPSTVPPAMMMPMNAMLPPDHAPNCIHDLAVNIEHSGEVLPEGQQLPRSSLSADNEHPPVHETMATVLQPPPADDAAAAAAAPYDAPAPAACEVTQLPVPAASASIATTGFHSRQSSSGSATSEESLPLDSNCAASKFYERRNKKKRPADFYERLKPEQQLQNTVTDITFSTPTGAGRQPCTSSVAAEQLGLQQDTACTPKSSGDESVGAAVVEKDTCGSTSVAGFASQQKLHQQPSVAAVNQGDSMQAVTGPARPAQNFAPTAETTAAGSAKTVTSDVPISSATGANSTPDATAAAATAAQPAQASTRDAPASHAAPIAMPSLAATVSATSVLPGVGSRTPGPLPAAGVPTATMSWAQRVQMQPGRAAMSQQAHDAAGQRTAAAGIASAKVTVQQPPTPPQSGDLGALLAAMELSSRPCAVHPRGFINKGNWCYANATLQALLACPMFYNFLAALPKDPALCAVGASKTPLLDALIALCSEFSHFERGSRSTSAATVVSPAATAQPAKASTVATAAPATARQPLLDLKPGPPLEPSIVSRLVQTMLSNSSAAFAHGKQEDAEEFHSALLDKLHNELLDAMKAAMPSGGSVGEASRPTSAATTALAVDQASSTSELDASSVNGNEVEWARVGPKNKHVVTRTADLARSPVTAIFGGKLLSSVTQAGSSKTANVEPFLAVQLEIQSDDITSVTKALSALAKRETIDGYTCAKTRQEIETHRRMVFEELPQVLILHLKCFVYDKNGLQKITKKIEFGETLSFSSDLLAFPNKYSLSQRTYKLCAVVHHSGAAATGGHYITDAFHSGVNCWVRYDDSNISVVSSQSVFEFAAPRMPYLLYYQRSDSCSAT